MSTIVPFKIEVIIGATYQHNAELSNTQCDNVVLSFGISGQLDKDTYLLPDGTPREQGLWLMQQALLDGLASNMRGLQKQGFASMQESIEATLTYLLSRADVKGESSMVPSSGPHTRLVECVECELQHLYNRRAEITTEGVTSTYCPACNQETFIEVAQPQ